jgi:hypothetical protein
MKKTLYGVAIALGTGLIVSACGGNNVKSDLAKSLEKLEQKLKAVNYMTADVDSVDFTMEVPDYMTPTNQLDVTRPFQYMNAIKEQYIVASSEDRILVEPSLKALKYEGKTFLDQYVSYNKSVIEEGVKITSMQEIKSLTIDGMDAKVLQFDGTVEGIAEPINYYTAFVEGKDKVYFIMTWTLESKKEAFKDVADKMIKSFKVKK